MVLEHTSYVPSGTTPAYRTHVYTKATEKLRHILQLGHLHKRPYRNRICVLVEHFNINIFFNIYAYISFLYPSNIVMSIYSDKIEAILCTEIKICHLQAFMTRSPRTSGFQSSQEVSKPSAKRRQKFLKCPLLTRDSEEQAVISVLSMVRTRAEPVSKSML